MIIASLLSQDKFARLNCVGHEVQVRIADGPAALFQIVREFDTALLVLDPELCDEHLIEGVERSTIAVQTVPMLVYSSLSPEALARAWRFARFGAELVLFDVHDDPSTLRHIIGRTINRAVEDALLLRIRPLLDRLPRSVAFAIANVIYSPDQARSGDDLARSAMMTRRSLYRHMAGINLRPRDVIESAQVLRAYLFLRDPSMLVKEAGIKLGFVDTRTLNSLVLKWTGVHPSELRRTVTPENLITLLATRLSACELNSEESLLSRPESAVDDAIGVH